MKKLNLKLKNNRKGITLIALVITIIVLLILAGVTIATLTGNNGILSRANEAKTETEKATAEEKVEVAVLGSYDNNGNISIEELNENLKNVTGLTSELPIEFLPTAVEVDGYEITILGDGNVILGKADGNFDEEKGVNTPKLGNNMELVVYNEETQKWVKDETNSAYSYVDTSIEGKENKSEWANAKVTMNGVESYFVWIPRYAYKIDSTNRTIDIKFIQGTGTTATDGVTECKYADDPTLNINTDYIIHPAFTTNQYLRRRLEYRIIRDMGRKI